MENDGFGGGVMPLGLSFFVNAVKKEKKGANLVKYAFLQNNKTLNLTKVFNVLFTEFNFLKSTI